MKEIEAKVLGIDPDAVQLKLRELGAEKIFDGEVTSIQFDRGRGMLRRRGEQLRLRRMGETVTLTFKKATRRGRTRTSKEFEVEVSDFEMTKRIITSLEYRPALAITKTRISYKLGRVRYELDWFPGLEPLIEIEAPSEGEVVRAAKRLGFDPKELRHATGAEIMAAVRRERAEARER
jgi:adenylate cyclase, class 2